jgi:hypothetical protein
MRGDACALQSALILTNTLCPYTHDSIKHHVLEQFMKMVQSQISFESASIVANHMMAAK